LPLPFPPADTVNQLALLVAVHVHPLVVVTVSVEGPPLAGIEGLVGDTAKAQGAACVTVTVIPATVIVPVRDELSVFAATV
jgi:hypothetical protein